MNPFVEWIAKQVFWMVVSYCAKKWGFEQTEQHFQNLIAKRKDLPSDPLPPPWKSKLPKMPWLK